MSTKEWIYDAVNGQLAEGEDNTHAGIVIHNEFKRGSECDRLYEEVCQLRKKLCKRYKANQIPELELIIDDMSEIARIIGLKMYDYGVMFGE